MWDLSSFVVGLMVGLILMILIVWALYSSRTFVFTVCPRQRNVCTFADYINSPGVALAGGYQVDDILFLDANRQLWYKRVPRNSGCTPISYNQNVRVLHPQYCLFTTADGSTNYEARNTREASPVYTFTDSDGQEVTVMTSKNCQVVATNPPDYLQEEGIPLVKWDAST